MAVVAPVNSRRYFLMDAHDRRGAPRLTKFAAYVIVVLMGMVFVLFNSVAISGSKSSVVLRKYQYL
jgi:hypothetical protein